MPYNKTTWDDDTTPLSASNMNHLETQYDEAIADITTEPQVYSALQSFEGGFGGNAIITQNGAVSDQYLGGFVEYNGASATTLTLPDPTVNGGKSITIWSNGTQLTLSTLKGSFYGVGVSASTTMPVADQQTLILLSDGYNWIVVGGSNSFLRTDSGAPNQQTVQNSVSFKSNIFPNAIGLTDSSGNITGWLLPQSGGGWYFANKANSASTLAMTDTGDMTVANNITAAGSINGTGPGHISYSNTYTTSTSESVTITISGLNAGASAYALAITGLGNYPNQVVVGNGSSWTSNGGTSYGDPEATISSIDLSGGTLTIVIGLGVSGASTFNIGVEGMVL
ncbi:hypothetical protein [Alicyclobacillus ferrooxydans]|uniref:Uncharacterized protein n=1 Tax=Alicyclobacillus ferrooxydans TaxID=471514 RepID=A0A0P9C9I7_9BACL|nr:hypothetical protein [Alicyclobacillus ferrooxydans]KPV42027.1 hypothetical protein AN477_19860 [Alicyclobacillus ferrooxydans]